MSCICRNCFFESESCFTECPQCNADYSQSMNQALPLGTTLANQFTICGYWHQNELTTTYLAKENESNRLVRVEEYFPNVTKRGDDGRSIVLINSESRLAFRTYASDLHDRWTRLNEVNSTHLFREISSFSENDTIYRVTEFQKVITFEQYLENHNGKLSFQDSKEILSPVITLLSFLHNSGITHNGICPQNILLDDENNIYLDGFSLSELRTVESGFNAELFDGYSAPEQYNRSSWQGEWTDIYSMGAIFYRAISGSNPCSAMDRLEKEKLLPLKETNCDISSGVSDTISYAMKIDRKKRFRTMELFLAALLADSDSETAIFASKESTKQFSPIIEKEKNGTAKLFSWLIICLMLASLIVNAILLIEVFGRNKLHGSENIMDKNYVGAYYPLLEDELLGSQKFIYQIHSEYTDEYPEGIIYKQSVNEGQIVPENNVIDIYVSIGNEYVEMPDLIGANESYSMRILSDYNLLYSVKHDATQGIGGADGIVIETNFEPGAKVRPKNTTNPDTIVLIVKNQE